MNARRASRGFTLVELLVALFALALLAIMSWRGLDGMTRAQSQTEARADEVLTLQVGLAQWAADLDSIVELPQSSALDWNGRVLRLTRRGTGSPADGVLVVAWTRRIVNGSGTWLRWQSPQVTTRGQLEEQWLQADTWSLNPGDAEKRAEVSVTPLDDWQIFYFRENAWTNPQSSDATNVPAAAAPVPPAARRNVIPDGVRLVLNLPQGHPISGILTRDWMRPSIGGNKPA
jgi:general secretion pathway protein J